MQKHARKRGLELAVRINGTSDLPALARRVAELCPDVVFYDYTKIPGALKPGPVHYTFSASESNGPDTLRAMYRGFNVAVVFSTKRGHPLPKHWPLAGGTFYYPVIDGDMSDLRFLDPPHVIVGLRAKGPAKRDRTGFVVRV